MNRYIESLRDFLAEQAPNFEYDDAKSILDILYYYYADTNPADNAEIRCQFKNLDCVLSKLPWSDCDRVFSLTVDLCISHARQAFSEGVQVGMRLFTELYTERNTEEPCHDG